MIASIWKDGEIACRGNIEVSLIDPPDSSSSRHWEGTLWVVEGGEFDIRGRYRMELDDGKSADFIVTSVLRRNPIVVHFRILAWKEKLPAVNGAPSSQ